MLFFRIFFLGKLQNPCESSLQFNLIVNIGASNCNTVDFEMLFRLNRVSAIQ